jgi:hypothetical protein
MILCGALRREANGADTRQAVDRNIVLFWWKAVQGKWSICQPMDRWCEYHQDGTLTPGPFPGLVTHPDEPYPY